MCVCARTCAWSRVGIRPRVHIPLTLIRPINSLSVTKSALAARQTQLPVKSVLLLLPPHPTSTQNNGLMCVKRSHRHGCGEISLMKAGALPPCKPYKSLLFCISSCFFLFHSRIQTVHIYFLPSCLCIYLYFCLIFCLIFDFCLFKVLQDNKGPVALRQ